MINNIHVAINPASGQPKPVLYTLNSVFRAAGVEGGRDLVGIAIGSDTG